MTHRLLFMLLLVSLSMSAFAQGKGKPQPVPTRWAVVDSLDQAVGVAASVRENLSGAVVILDFNGKSLPVLVDQYRAYGVCGQTMHFTTVDCSGPPFLRYGCSTPLTNTPTVAYYCPDCGGTGPDTVFYAVTEPDSRVPVTLLSFRNIQQACQSMTPSTESVFPLVTGPNLSQFTPPFRVRLLP